MTPINTNIVGDLCKWVTLTLSNCFWQVLKYGYSLRKKKRNGLCQTCQKNLKRNADLTWRLGLNCLHLTNYNYNSRTQMTHHPLPFLSDMCRINTSRYKWVKAAVGYFQQASLIYPKGFWCWLMLKADWPWNPKHHFENFPATTKWIVCVSVHLSTSVCVCMSVFE